MFTLSQIVAELGGELIGEDAAVRAVAPAARAQAGEITFLANPKYRSEAERSAASAVIVSPDMAEHFPERSLIVAADPYLYFAKTARLFHPADAARAGVHPSAVIEPSARVPASCEIGAHVYIGENTVLGERCRILANAVVERDCTLGDDVVLHSGCVIGADGFGLAFDGGGWLKIPQTGGVSLGDDVEIGANTTVDRGAMSDTAIGRGSKLDNQIQIAHNCRIGEHTVIASCTGVSGSVSIGSYCVIGGGVGTVGHIEIADKTTIGGGTSVTHSIRESGTHYAGIYPMQPYKEWTKNAVLLKRLNEMYRKIKELEAQSDGVAE